MNGAHISLFSSRITKKKETLASVPIMEKISLLHACKATAASRGALPPLLQPQLLGVRACVRERARKSVRNGVLRLGFQALLSLHCRLSGSMQKSACVRACVPEREREKNREQLYLLLPQT